MGSAAFCSECYHWVWVSPDGGCSNGHQRSCLRRVHETNELPTAVAHVPAPPPATPGPAAYVAPVPVSVPAEPAAQPAMTTTAAAPTPAVHPYAPEWASTAPGSPALAGAYGSAPASYGAGASAAFTPQLYGSVPIAPNGLPAGVSSFNWGAFFFPVLWPFVYGLNNMGWIALGGTLAANFLGGLLPDPLGGLAGFVPLGISIWVGLEANKEYWKTNPKRLSAEEFSSKQRKWLWVGIGMTVLGVLVGVALILFAMTMLRGMLGSMPAGSMPTQTQVPVQFQ